MEGFPGWTTRFELLWRQEQSRHASGRTRVKDFGTPIWMAAYQSIELNPNQIDEWRGRLDALENGMVPFRAWSKSRCWPILHPKGVGAVNGVIEAVGVDNKSIRIDWTGGTTNLTAGDMVEINSNRLYRVVSGPDGSGFVGLRPHLSVGTLDGQAVNINKPGILMTIVPGSVSTQTGLNGRGSVTFQATEARG